MDIEEHIMEEEMECEMDVVINKTLKRGIEEKELKEKEIDEEWEQVKTKPKKARQEESRTRSQERENKEKYEIYISSQDPMPKQFALARLFRDLKICDVAHIKYLNPYKIRVQFFEEKSLDDLSSHETLKNKGWRFSKRSEVSYSYGVIKDVDLELTEEEIMKNICCPETVELISLKRLQRRNKDRDSSDRWKTSESVRLCFKGNWLPPFVYVYDTRVMVEPYVYPVTQCFQCWRLCHTVKTCTTKKTICPKCSGEHANCDTKLFKCINCSGNHMAMSKSCPVFIKEKAIRSIMAERNCTYTQAAKIQAITPIIVPASLKRDPLSKTQVIASTSGGDVKTTDPDIEGPFTFGSFEVCDNPKDDSDARSERSTILPIIQPKKKQKKKKSKNFDWSVMVEEELEDQKEDSTPGSSQQPPKITTFGELISRIKEVIFMNNLDFKTKVKRVIQLCVEWIMIFAADKITDWPMCKLIYGLIKNNDG